MKTKRIKSTEAQNNFGRLIDLATMNRTMFVITRRGEAIVVLMGINELRNLLESQEDQTQVARVIREVTPEYEIGESID